MSLHTGSEQATGHVQWGVVYDEGTGAVPWPARAHPRLLTLPFTRVPVRGIAGGSRRRPSDGSCHRRDIAAGTDAVMRSPPPRSDDRQVRPRRKIRGGRCVGAEQLGHTGCGEHQGNRGGDPMNTTRLGALAHEDQSLHALAERLLALAEAGLPAMYLPDEETFVFTRAGVISPEGTPSWNSGERAPGTRRSPRSEPDSCPRTGSARSSAGTPRRSSRGCSWNGSPGW